MNKKLLLALLIILTLPTLVGAQTIQSMAKAAAGVVFAVGTWIVVIMWVVTGILFLISLGDPGKLKTARAALFTSIGGTLIIILANTAVSIVGSSFGL